MFLVNIRVVFLKMENVLVGRRYRLLKNQVQDNNMFKSIMRKTTFSKSTSTISPQPLSPLEGTDVTDCCIKLLNGEKKLSSIIVREEETSKVLLVSQNGSLWGNGEGFLALQADCAQIAESFNKDVLRDKKCGIDLVDIKGIIMERLTFYFDNKKFESYLFVSEK